MDAFIDEVQKQVGDIAILVNNAGITRDNLALRMKDADWDEVIETNLRAVFRLSRAVMRGMMKARWAASSTSLRWSASRATPARRITPPPRPAWSA